MLVWGSLGLEACYRWFQQSTVCTAGIPTAGIVATGVGNRSVLRSFGLRDSHACGPLVWRRSRSRRESVCNKRCRLHHRSARLRVHSAPHDKRALGIAGPGGAVVDRRSESANVRRLRHTAPPPGTLCLLWIDAAALAVVFTVKGVYEDPSPSHRYYVTTVRRSWRARRDGQASDSEWSRDHVSNADDETDGSVAHGLSGPPAFQCFVACFGMGTTYRSLMSWNVSTTAVELVPSVPHLFGYFHPDEPKLLKSRCLTS